MTAENINIVIVFITMIVFSYRSDRNNYLALCSEKDHTGFIKTA